MLPKLFAKVVSFLTALMGLPVLSAASSDAQREVTVFIECVTDTGKTRTGSGVVVSEIGHVLTARHVVSRSTACTARIGSRLADPIGLEAVSESDEIPDSVDAQIMRIKDPPDKSFAFATTCMVNANLDRQFITALAYSRMSKDLPSASRGIISTTDVSTDGIVEIDLHLSRQRSGGPIFLDGQTAIVGIVKGVEVDRVELLADTYKMTALNPLVGLGSILSESPYCNALPPPVEITETELESWASLEAGNCNDLKRHLAAFPAGGYSEIAQALILSERVERFEVWKPGLTRELALYEFGYPPQATEAAARSVLENTIDAKARCRPLYQTSMRAGDDPTARYDVTCRTTSAGTSCNAEGLYLCPVEERQLVTKSYCGSLE